jgi:membrane protein implicated in regulation of membrane protease activity
MFSELLTSEPLIWIVIAVIFAIIEAFTMGLTTIWFTIGGVVACIVALMGASLLIQIIVFFAVSIILLYFTRSLAEKRLKIGHEKNITEQMIGKTGLVTETIEPHNTGQVKVNGMVWTAVSKNNSEILLRDEIVKIVRIEGVKLIVERVKGED